MSLSDSFVHLSTPPLMRARKDCVTLDTSPIFPRGVGGNHSKHEEEIVLSNEDLIKRVAYRALIEELKDENNCQTLPYLMALVPVKTNDSRHFQPYDGLSLATLLNSNKPLDTQARSPIKKAHFFMLLQRKKSASRTPESLFIQTVRAGADDSLIKILQEALQTPRNCLDAYAALQALNIPESAVKARLCLKFLKTAAKCGDIVALHFLEEHYRYSGKRAKARQCADQLDAVKPEHEIYERAWFYRFSRGLPKTDSTKRKAAELFKLAAEKYGLPEAKTQYGICLLDSIGVEDSDTNKERGVEVLLEAAKLCSALAMHRLALCFSNGIYFEPDEGRALEWHENAAKNGNTESQFWMGQHYEKNPEKDPDKKLAKKCYRDARNHGHAAAMYALGRLVPGSQLELFEEAAKLGHVDAMVGYGLLLCFNKKEDEGFTWLEKAHRQGHPNAGQFVTALQDNLRGLAKKGISATDRPMDGSQLRASGSTSLHSSMFISRSSSSGKQPSQ